MRTISGHLSALILIEVPIVIDEDELQWYIPATILPSDLQGMINVINQFLETPFELEGKKVSSLLSKKRRRRRRHTSSPEPEDNVLENDEPGKKRKEKKKKEKEQYKSAQFIEDSDEEYGDMQTFLEKEETLRQKAALAGAAANSQATRPVGMKAHGTKKRRQKNTATKSTSGEKETIGDMSTSLGSRRSPPDEDSDERNSSSETAEESDDDDVDGLDVAQTSSTNQTMLARHPHNELVRTAAEE